MDRNVKIRRSANRKWVQLYAALLYNAHTRGFLEGKLYTGSAKALCVPGLNCYSCPGAVGACPLGSLQNALCAGGHGALWYVIGTLALFGAVLGRAVCGWLCPVGLIQEGLHKIPTPKMKKGRVTRALTWLKYGVLLLFVVILPLWWGLFRRMPLPAFCKFICPAGTLEGAAALLSAPGNEGLFAQLGALFTGKWAIMTAVGLLCVFCYRSFCRFLCPLGAIYSLFNRFSLVGVRVDGGKCGGCGACVQNCKMDVKRVGDRECIFCGECAGSCAKGAISLQCGKATLRGPKTEGRGGRGRIIAAALLAILMGAVVYFNWIDVPKDQPPVTVGWDVGEELADFSCVLTDGSAFHLADYQGQVVIINQWATYCTPCVAELPYFEQLRKNHPDIVVLAAHHWLEATPEAAPYIEQMGWTDWGVRFAVDTPDENILSKIHGDNTMPRTVVLDRQGRVIFNEQRSVTYEMLEELLKKAEKNQ